VKPPRKKKKKGSLGESFAVLKSSPKILSLAMLVMSYGVSHRLFEFAWKGQLRVLFPSAQAYQVNPKPYFLQTDLVETSCACINPECPSACLMLD